MSQRSLGQALLPPAWHQSLQAERHPINQFVRRQFLPLLTSNMKVLDAGSGQLHEQHLRYELLARGVALETLDFQRGEGIDHVVDVADTRLPDQSYDALLCMQVLEHVPNPQAVCRELYRLSKPGARVVVTAPQSAWLHNLPWHFFHFTNNGMRQMLEEAGFEVLALEPQGGHFTTMALMSHYTCRVVDTLMARRGNPFWYRPVSIALRIWNGFVLKTTYLWLDRVLFWEGNTQGWNALCQRRN